MSNVLNFKMTLEDLLGPKVAAAIRSVQNLGQQVEKPHRLNVDASKAKGALSGVMGLVGKLGLATALAAGAKEVVTMGANLEQTKIQFETFTGSAEKGNAVIAQLQKFAQITPFDDEQVISAGRQLLAFGEDAGSLNPILTKLGNISSATGKDFGELVSLYGKNKLSGLIQGEDLNQLVESGIPVMDSFARQLGVSVSEVRKMGSEGKISFAMLDKAFDELGGKSGKWGSLMDKQSASVAGRWSSLIGFAQNLGGKLGEMLNPFIGKLIDGGNAVLTFIQQNSDKMRAMYEPVVEALQPLFDAFEEVRQQLFGNAEAGDILAGVFNVIANIIRFTAPVYKIVATLLGKVVLVVWDLISAVVKFIEASPKLQKFFAGLWEGAVAAFKGIAEAAGKFLGGVGNILKGILTLSWDDLKTGFSQTMEALADGSAPALGMKAAAGFAEGYKNGIQPIKLFGTDKATASTDAATGFMQGTGKKPAAMTADATKGKTTGAAVSGGSHITHITLNANNPFRDPKFYITDLAADAKSTMDQFGNWLMANLNDVNTYAST